MYVYACRLLTCIKRTCYTIENKITKMQMSRKKNTILCTIRKKHVQLDDEKN